MNYNIGKIPSAILVNFLDELQQEQIKFLNIQIPKYPGILSNLLF